MAQTWANLRDDIESILQDGGIDPAATTANSVHATAEIDLRMKEGLRRMSTYAPYYAKESFKIESRTGIANGNTASALVDSSESQFVSGDVGKIAFNYTDKTWAYITAYVSATQLTLSWDAFPDGNEEYRIYNSNCFDNRSIDISDLTDRLYDPVEAEYPIGVVRPCTVLNDILTLDLPYDPEDSKTLSSGIQPNTEVLVHVAKRHRVSQLTDLAGAVNNGAGYAAGSTSMAVNELQATGTVEEGQEFTIADMRGTYRVTADATISSNAVSALTFWPGLENAVLDNAVITFKLSTLTPLLESLFCNYVACLQAFSKGFFLINKVNTGSGDAAAQFLRHWQALRAETERGLKRLAVSKAYTYNAY